MFVFMVYQNAKRSESQAEDIDAIRVQNEGQSKHIEATYEVVIKLIDRWNKSDEISQRHREDVIREVNELQEKVAEIRGSMSRINGK
jgi:hypothetical protein